MPNCPGCAGDIQKGERFCGQCGTAIDQPAPALEKAAPIPEKATPVGSVSKIELDPQLVNTLLAVYANKVDGPQLRLEGGRLKVAIGEFSMDVNPIRLNQAAQVLLKAGPLGNLNLSIDLLHLGEQGLEVQLRLQ